MQKLHEIKIRVFINKVLLKHNICICSSIAYGYFVSTAGLNSFNRDYIWCFLYFTLLLSSLQIARDMIVNGESQVPGVITSCHIFSPRVCPSCQNHERRKLNFECHIFKKQ